MVDFDRVIACALGEGAGAAGGLLASRAGRRFGRRALPAGAVAAVAGVAWSAFERHRRGRGASLASGPSLAFLPPAADPEPRGALGLALVRAMIAAARAGGKLDPRARAKRLAEIRLLDLDTDEKALLRDELDRPIGLGEVAASADSPERAAELYVAALLAIDADTEKERAWLARLAARLALPRGLVAEIHERLARELGEERAQRRSPPARAAAG